jgi:hypothetical protein
MLFASAEQLDFRRSRPIDDIISLTYHMIYLLSGGKIPYFEELLTHDFATLELMEQFTRIQELK